MTILVKKISSSSYECVSGHMQLEAGLGFGKVTVTDIETQEQIEVHMVDGEIIVLATVAKGAAETLAAAAIERAAQSSAECPLCGGSGGWPGVSGHVICRPCDGTGKQPSTKKN
ncbi:MAG: hypothetical protein V4713_03710 [Pseudomonadota bacterium]